MLADAKQDLGSLIDDPLPIDHESGAITRK
jgi:hypothetical protein